MELSLSLTISEASLRMRSGLNGEGACSSRESQERQQEDELKVVLCEPKINRPGIEREFQSKFYVPLIRYTRLLRVAMHYAQLQAYMAWYSTLGGAHS